MLIFNLINNMNQNYMKMKNTPSLDSFNSINSTMGSMNNLPKFTMNKSVPICF